VTPVGSVGVVGSNAIMIPITTPAAANSKSLVTISSDDKETSNAVEKINSETNPNTRTHE